MAARWAQRSRRQRARRGTAHSSPSVGLARQGVLSTATRYFMERRFGWDFSRLRVHTDEAAAQSARAINANAYTVGHHVVFGTGQFAPTTHEGRRLIAHELTHVLQQSDASRVHADAISEGRRQGNAPLYALPISPLQVQRDEIEFEGIDVRPKGLLAEKHTKSVTGRWLALWRSKKDFDHSRVAWRDAQDHQRRAWRVRRVAPIAFDPTPAATEGGFRHQEWRTKSILASFCREVSASTIRLAPCRLTISPPSVTRSITNLVTPNRRSS